MNTRNTLLDHRGTAHMTATNADDALNRLLRQTCRKLGAREIVLRYLDRPSSVRWIATALIIPHRVADKLRADLQSEGPAEVSFSFADLGRYNDMPIARGEGPTAFDAIGAMMPVTWSAPK
jgi:hypothetical protein